MEQNFQTSFIPKRTIVKERVAMPSSIGFSTVVGMLILFAVVIGTGGLYFYKGVLAKNITEMEGNLNRAKNRFEPAKIAELEELDRRLNAASEILSRHTMVTPIFEELSNTTMKTVRFTSFDYSEPTETVPRVTVNMKGVAIGYRSVALQADLFSANKKFINPIFSNLQLDEKGNVRFDLSFSVDESFINYRQNILTKNGISF